MMLQDLSARRRRVRVIDDDFVLIIRESVIIKRFFRIPIMQKNCITFIEDQQTGLLNFFRLFS